MASLKGKVALVTGASRGIGAAIARRLAMEGADIAITYVKDGEAAASVIEAVEANGVRGIALQADALDVSAIRGAVATTVAIFGSLDILVNNAGIVVAKKVEETTLEEMNKILDVNVRGVFATSQAALKHMKANGRIINIGSCVGERLMMPDLVLYAATKGAVKMFTQGLARELGPRGITVNNIQPGPIDTDMNPAERERAVGWKNGTVLDRFGTPDEVAALVAFIAGPESSYITGANLTVDGGTNA